jgi:hypothetical protein
VEASIANTSPSIHDLQKTCNTILVPIKVVPIQSKHLAEKKEAICLSVVDLRAKNTIHKMPSFTAVSHIHNIGDGGEVQGNVASPDKFLSDF